MQQKPLKKANIGHKEGHPDVALIRILYTNNQLKTLRELTAPALYDGRDRQLSFQLSLRVQTCQ